ncbi:MAG: tetratricopeptide repeat protein [Pseudomonadales bacterium]|nr:tetratricopeptide repeat protein [Pseudomonadales bacterium]
MAEPDASAVRAPFAGETLGARQQRTDFEQRDGAYVIRTQGPGGAFAEYPVRYSFGVEPLQQYLLELPGGRLQAHGAARDTRGAGEWFELYTGAGGDPEDPEFWTAPSRNWNHMCADCHSTAVRKGYDAATDTFTTTFEEISVGCEACHGPGSAHAEAAGDGLPPVPLVDLSGQALQLETCAPCHSRRTQLAEGFLPGDAWLDHYLPSLLEEGAYHADGQILDEVYVWGSFLQSRMHQAGVRCTDCHDAHSARVSPEDATCTRCHGGARRGEFPGLAARSYDDPAHHFHPPESEGARCVSCHMTARTYMEIDARRDHSFRVPRPDLASTTGAPDACTACHEDRTPDWAAAQIARRFGTERRPHYGEVLAGARRRDPAQEAALGRLASDPATAVIVRATALALAVGYAGEASGQALLQGLQHEDPLLRIGAIRGARRFDPGLRWRALAPLLDDERAAVRREAVVALLDVRGELDGAARSRLDAAIRSYLRDLELVADRADGQTRRAGALLALGDVAGAETALRQALARQPSWVPALVNLADLHRATGRDPLGGPLLERALELAPDSADALVARALWLVRQGQNESALPLLARASALEPAAPERAYLFAVALSSSGRPGEALAALDAALGHRPEAEALIRLAAGIARDVGDEARMAGYLRRLEASAP